MMKKRHDMVHLSVVIIMPLQIVKYMVCQPVVESHEMHTAMVIGSHGTLEPEGRKYMKPV